MCYGVYFAAKKLKPYFQEHPITVVCTAPLAEIIGNRDASGRVAKWAIALAPYTIFYQPRTAIKSQALADFLVDWAETQYLPPAPDSTHWRMHFDGSKMRTGLGAGIVSEVLSSSKQNYPHYQKMCYGVYFAAKKLKPYFQEHPITVVCTAPLAEIIGNRDASGRVAKWAIALAPYTIFYQPRTAIKSQALADFLVDWAETQYLPPAPDSTHWRMHFDGSKMRTGLGAGIVLTSPTGDKLKYTLQIHFAASNNVAEYEALVHGLRLAKELGIRRILCYGDSDLVVQQSSGDWDAKDANMASYQFLVQQISGYYEGCEFLHVPRADNDQADALAWIGSTRQAIPTGVSLQRLLKPSIKPSPESDSIFVPPGRDPVPTAGSRLYPLVDAL